jgi:hypothetical protein
MFDAVLPDDGGACDPGAERAARQAQALQALTGIGLRAAQALETRLHACEADAVACELALALTRVARAVRLTLALEARLGNAQALRDETRAAQAAEARAAAAAGREARIETNAGRVSDAVEMAIAAQTAGARDGGYESEQLSEALSEHLRDGRETDGFADMPVSAAVAQVCRALGVRVDWSLWRNEDWALDEWRAGTPGSPYADTARAGDGPRPSLPDPPPRGPPARASTRAPGSA